LQHFTQPVRFERLAAASQFDGTERRARDFAVGDFPLIDEQSNRFLGWCEKKKDAGKGAPFRCDLAVQIKI
jgi:hypothetical protein